MGCPRLQVERAIGEIYDVPKLAHSLECHSPRVPIEVIQIALHMSSFLPRQELGGAPGRGNLSTDYIRRTDNFTKPLSSWPQYSVARCTLLVYCRSKTPKPPDCHSIESPSTEFCV